MTSLPDSPNHMQRRKVFASAVYAKKKLLPSETSKVFHFLGSCVCGGTNKNNETFKTEKLISKAGVWGRSRSIDAWVVGSWKRLKVAFYRARMKLLLPIRDRAMSAEKVFFLFLLCLIRRFMIFCCSTNVRSLFSLSVPTAAINVPAQCWRRLRPEIICSHYIIRKNISDEIMKLSSGASCGVNWIRVEIIAE